MSFVLYVLYTLKYFRATCTVGAFTCPNDLRAFLLSSTFLPYTRHILLLLTQPTSTPSRLTSFFRCVPCVAYKFQLRYLFYWLTCPMLYVSYGPWQLVLFCEPFQYTNFTSIFLARSKFALQVQMHERECMWLWHCLVLKFLRLRIQFTLNKRISSNSFMKNKPVLPWKILPIYYTKYFLFLGNHALIAQNK